MDSNKGVRFGFIIVYDTYVVCKGPPTTSFWMKYGSWLYSVQLSSVQEGKVPIEEDH